MSQERNFGVTEAGVGLTVITFLLVGLGYWIVQRLGGSGETPPVEVRPSATLDDSAGAAPNGQNQQPRVLVAEQPDAADLQLPHTANRPLWLSHQEESEAAPTQGVDGFATPLSPDAQESPWPPVEQGSDREPSWAEPIQVR